MVRKAFSIFDVKADVYSPPFFVGTVGEAMRGFQELVNDKQTTPGKYPGDFKLCHIGEFDDVSGILTPCVITGMGFGSDFVALPSGAVPIGLKNAG